MSTGANVDPPKNEKVLLYKVIRVDHGFGKNYGVTSVDDTKVEMSRLPRAVMT